MSLFLIVYILPQEVNNFKMKYDFIVFLKLKEECEMKSETRSLIFRLCVETHKGWCREMQTG